MSASRMEKALQIARMQEILTRNQEILSQYEKELGEIDADLQRVPIEGVAEGLMATPELGEIEAHLQRVRIEGVAEVLMAIPEEVPDKEVEEEIARLEEEIARFEREEECNELKKGEIASKAAVSEAASDAEIAAEIAELEAEISRRTASMGLSSKLGKVAIPRGAPAVLPLGESNSQHA